MKIPVSRLPAALFSKRALLLLIVVMGLILFALYRYASQQLPANQAAEALKEQFADRWKASFQQMLLSETATPEAILTLAEQLAEKGYWYESSRLLAEKMPYPFPDAFRQRVADVKLKNSLDAYYVASADGKRDSAASKQEVRTQLQAIGDTRQMPIETVTTLAKQSADFDLFPQAAMLYAQLAERQGAHASSWWAEAAKWAGQAGDEVSAEAYLRKALEQAANADEVRLYTFAWMKQAAKAGQQAVVAKQIQDTAPQLGSAPADLAQLATISQSLARPELSSQLYDLLAQQDVQNQQKWYEKAAYWAEQAGQFPQAAHFMEQALVVAMQPSEIHALRVRLLDAWKKARQPDKALHVAKQLLDPQTSDWGLLEKGIFVALAARDIKQAREWNQRYLEFNPDQAAAYLRQADIEIMAKDFAQASFYLKEAVRLEPDNIVLRERWAFVADRSGDNALARSLWGWLYERTGKPEYQRHQVQVAHGTLQGAGLDFLRQLAQKQPLPGSTAQDVFQALAAQSPDEAEAFMRDYLTRHSIQDRQQWQYLADWQAGQRRLEQALATWRAIETVHGVDAQTKLMRMQLHWELKQTDMAAAILDEVDMQFESATPYQLEILGELSWQRQDYAQAVVWYERLLAAAPPETPVATRVAYYTRLAGAQQAMGSTEVASQTLQAAWQATGQPDLLLNAMQLALDAGQPETVVRLVALAEQQPQAFELQGRYWLLRGQLAAQQQQLVQAREFYQHLLVIEPDFTPLRKQALFQYLELVQNGEDANEFERLFQELEGATLETAEKNRLYELAVSRALAQKDDQKLAGLRATIQAQGIVLSPWLQLGIAMKVQDKPAIARLLASGASLSLGDRVSALTVLGREDEAYAEARRAVRHASSESEREQARALVISLAEGRVSSVVGSVKSRQMDGLDTQEQTVSFQKGQGEDGVPFGYSLKASHTRLSGTVVPDGVQHETDVTAGIHWQGSGHQVDATVGVNQREDSTEPHANVRLRKQLSGSVSGNVSYGYHEVPEESAWLRANAQRNQLQAGLEARLDEHNHAQLSVWQNAFSERGSGQVLAEGQGGRAALVHRDRIGEKTEWFAGLQGSVENYETANGVSERQLAGVPADARSLALLAGISNGAPGGRIPLQDDNLHYSLSTAIGKQWPEGAVTHHVEASLGKRLNQDDEVNLSVLYDKGNRTGADHSIFLQYRKWLDFMEEDEDER